jgi:leucyl/phenylalanyl-tRNA--protein transferase
VARQEPPASRWSLPDPATAPRGEELLGVGADLAPGTVLAAYRRGLFPMPVRRRGPVGWWSPDPRGVIPLDGLRVTRSLRASARRYRITTDAAFEQVVSGCADPRRPQGWSTPAVADAYVELHRLGWAHSVEVWSEEGLAGGLYGVEIGGLFAGESMFHRGRDASKVALLALVDRLRAAARPELRLLDVQWLTPHLASLGALEISRADYLSRLADALSLSPVY